MALTVLFPEVSQSVSPPPAPPVMEVQAVELEVPDPVEEAAVETQRVDAFLKRHNVRENSRTRIAESIVASAKKHDLSPKLLASIVIVESQGNPFAISGQDAVGIMQIHLPTWGDTADRENINLFRIEDNIDFGARILKDYVSRFGMSEGVRRYNGFIPGEPTLEQSSTKYLTRVREVFDFGDFSRS